MVAGVVAPPIVVAAIEAAAAVDDTPADEGMEEGGAPDPERCKRERSAKLRKKWEAETGLEWPKDSNGRNFDVSHKKPLAEGGTNETDNIEPLRHDDHMRQHMDNGDFVRWGARSGGPK